MCVWGGGGEGGKKQYFFESEFFPGLLETKMIITALWLLRELITVLGKNVGNFFTGML